jgi:hypothetical protein
MQRAALFLFVAALPLMAGAAAPKPAWYSCAKNEDCVMTDGLCGEVISINVRYKKEYIRTRPVTDCVANSQLMNTPRAVCLQKKCGFDIPPIYGVPQ